MAKKKAVAKKTVKITKVDPDIKGKKDLLLALEKSLGIISHACKKLKISRQKYYDYIKDPEFAKEVEHINEATLDFVESKHYQNISQGDVASIIFHLKTKGKNRGYDQTNVIEKEATNETNNSFNIVVNSEDEKETIQAIIDKFK